MANRLVLLDLDGTIAEERQHAQTIGLPLPGAQDFVRALKGLDLDVRIWTARIGGPDSERTVATNAVHVWLAQHGFPPLPIYSDAGKPRGILSIIDNRAVACSPGERGEGFADALAAVRREIDEHSA